MKNGIILAAFMAALCASAETVKTATQPWVRAYVATNRTDVSGKADKTNTYTKAEADAKIVELSPPADLTDATNYTDRALGAFASTGAVKRAELHGTAERWTDAQGRVWEIVRSDDWSVVNTGLPAGEDIEWYGPSWVTETDGDYYHSVGWYIASHDRTPELIGSDQNATTLRLDWNFWRETESFEVHTVFSRQISTNLVGSVALTNDIPDVSGYATPADVTAAIREQSLGGIYDSELGVWWTPIMQNGALRYTATTNVNLNAEN